jgi:dTDP-4-amino-4,6-dideoxygalactose transaminase
VFTRARPHVDVGALLRQLEGTLPEPFVENEGDDLHFSSGRSALKWLLSGLRQRRGRPLTVAVQAFTCEAVVCAIEESGNSIAFVDVDASTCSTPAAVVEACSADVFVLTHLFGLPNPDYVAIANLCEARGILLIEDLAQSAGASISGYDLGSLGDFSIFSFAFDKPVSTYQGGMLRVGRRQDAAEWRRSFARLPAESETTGLTDLAALYFLFLETDPGRYRFGALFPSLACATIARLARSYRRKHALTSAAARVPGYRIAERVWAGVLHRSPIIVRRMSVTKRRYLDVLLTDLPNLAHLRRQWLALARTELAVSEPSVDLPATPAHGAPAPARLAVLVAPGERQRLIDRFARAGMEAGAFNWPYVAVDLAKRSVVPNRAESFPQSRILAARILNLPLWSAENWFGFAERAH